jgi:acetyl esterase/lipase
MVATAGLLLAASAAARPMSAYLDQPGPERHVYAVRDDRELVLHVFRPAAAAADERRPALVWIHGGAWVGGTVDGFLPHARYFADRGVVGFVITYRLVRPDGPGIADAIADCRSALRHVRAHAERFGVDPARVAVAGDSAGGHLAAALGTLAGYDHPEDDTAVSGRPDAMILYNPVLDLTEDDWVRYAVGGVALADRRSPRPADAASLARARALSPLHHVAPGLPPAIVLHGRADRIVPVSQAERFATALQAAGNRCGLVTPPDLGHAFVIARYKWPEPVVVEAVREADRFLASLGWIAGEPTLAVSPEPAWTPLPR